MVERGPANTSSPYEACLALALDKSTDVAMHAVTQACASLMEAAIAAYTQADRSRLADAAEALRRFGPAIQAGFTPSLREEMERGQEASPAARPLTFQSLELMAEDQVENTVEVMRGQQLVITAVEADLVEFNALMSAAQGQQVVRAGVNPLRPEVWVRALLRALEQARTPSAARAPALHHMSRALGPQLQVLYRMLSRQLGDAGVAAAGFGIAAQAPAPPPRAAEPEAAKDDSPPVTLRDLKRLLASASGRASFADEAHTVADAMPTQQGMTVPAAMEALKDMEQAQDVVRRMHQRWRDGVWQSEPVNPQDAGAFGSTSYTPQETLAREVVRLMVANVADDPRLLPQVRDVVQALEPALQRLVMRDQRFFTDREHPARRLLDEATQRSLAWPEAKAEGFADFLEPLRQVSQSLAQSPVEDAAGFQGALDILRQSWAELESRARRERRQVERALLKADLRNHRAAKLSSHLQASPDVAAAPSLVRSFLAGPWSQVMAAAQLGAGKGEVDPQGYAGLVNDLVWMSQPQLASQNPARLAQLTPRVLQKLRGGLSSIGYPEEKTRDLFNHLFRAHLQAVRGAAEAPAPPAQPADTLLAQPEGMPWLTPQEVSESQPMPVGGLEATTDFRQTVPQSAAEAPPPAAGLRIEELRPGQYVEVFSHGGWARWRLSKASPHGLLFMFTDGLGRPQSMSRQTLEHLALMGAVRPMPERSVIDTALDAVAQQALRNSTDFGD